MKNLKKRLIVLSVTLGILFGSVAISYAVNGGDTFITQRDPTNTFNMTNLLPLPASNAVITLDTSTNLPTYGLLGSGLNFNTGSQTLSVVNVPESSITNLTSDLAGKMSIPTGTTNQVVLGNGTLGTLPVIPSPVSSTYQAFLTQSGTSAPNANQYVNDFTGTTFTWARTGAGVYTVTASNPVFTANKTAVLMSNPPNYLNNYKYTVTSSTVITLQTASLSVVSLILTPGNTDTLLSNTMFYVVVYP